MATQSTEQTLSESIAKKTSRFPSAFTVLAVVLLVTWALTFVIPTGAYKIDKDGHAIAGTYHHVNVNMSLYDRFMQLFMSFVNGTYGIRDNESGMISAYGNGELYGAIQVFIFVMVIGMFITMCTKFGALDAGIATVAKKLGNKGALLIIGLMVVFSVLGSIEGFGEETLGLYALFVPLMISLGYDRMTAAATLMLGAGMGVMASTINPFATGVASQIAGVSITTGGGLRLVMWLVFTIIGCWWVVRYANLVKADPTKSLCKTYDEDKTFVGTLDDKTPEFNLQRKLVLLLFLCSFIFMVFSFMPWSKLLKGDTDKPFSWELGWYMPEATALFLFATIIAGLIMRLSEKELTDTLIEGAADFTAPALIIALARGITVIMDNGQITGTILHWLENSMGHLPNWLFLVVLYIFYIPLSFLVPSTSGLAALSMPIFGQLTKLHGMDPSLAVTAFQTASGWMNLFTPTSAIIMGGLVLSKVGFDKWMRFIAPLLAIYFILGCFFMAVSAFI